MTQAHLSPDSAPAVRPADHRDGDAVRGGRLARPRRRRPAGDAPRRRAAQRRAGDQRHHRGVADHHRRREGATAPCGRRGRRRPGAKSSPASAPTTPGTPSSWPRPPRRPARTGCWWSRRTTTSRRRRGWSAHFTAVADATALPVMLYDIPHRPACRSPPRPWSASPSTSASSRVKDAKGDLVATSWVTSRTDLAYLLRRRRHHPAGAGRRRGRHGRHLHALHRRRHQADDRGVRGR